MSKEQFFQKGESFEADIISAVSNLLKDSPHRIIAGMRCECPMLQSKTEIDICIATDSVIYIIEAKSFRSSLEGNLNDKMWEGFSGQYSQKIYNPYYQHKLHLRSLRREFRKHNYTPPPNIKDVIVVPNSCTIKSDAPNILTLGTFLTELEDTLASNATLNLNLISEVLTAIRGGAN